ncbi:hypothetical protein MTR_3g048675 [Medicago truncatula]|uniref:Uncharacterized protein n=1 Tax=Medicago truncatula TaxID=3880 RepID=A0A072UV39_MEDTR|nr:hypothetical protein MTR_3g048675 [Medicago truncatula]
MGSTAGNDQNTLLRVRTRVPQESSITASTVRGITLDQRHATTDKIYAKSHNSR